MIFTGRDRYEKKVIRFGIKLDSYINDVYNAPFI
jgi:hypothetical protein